MRFWPTYRRLQLWTSIMCLAIAPMQLLGLSSSAHRWWDITRLILFLFNGVFGVCSYLSFYWELQSDVLFENRLFRRRRVPYADILSVKRHVSTWNPDHFALVYDARRPDGKPARLYLNPADEDGFFSVLRDRAPQADFAIEAPPRLSLQP